ncbi:redoxin domain-containing protein [Peribacillus frigoritolerans]|uniref:redoxin domain-containing protein n=1 Tax=Peribacillus frigoritolerans TaxID=450367 RepID=UPI00105A1582|nr:redoxin domain-containing protein [Peribacillus frigoritolerans]TDL83190.1 redoxin domain-containing protein [Peribacillus frigoritolerans]
MKLKRILAIGLLVFLAGYAIWFAILPKEPKEGLEVGNKPPQFELEMLNGENVQLDDVKGKKVMVNFWATWCPPCEAEMPEMQKLQNEHQDNLVVLAVNMTNAEKSREDVESFISKRKLTFPVALDKDGRVSVQYEVYSYPTTYFLDEEGKIMNISRGAMTKETMEKLLEM